MTGLIRIPWKSFLDDCVNVDERIKNPTVAEALKNVQTLRVVDTVWVDDLTGSNCRGRKRKRKFLEAEDCTKLPKRRRHSSR